MQFWGFGVGVFGVPGLCSRSRGVCKSKFRKSVFCLLGSCLRSPAAQSDFNESPGAIRRFTLSPRIPEIQRSRAFSCRGFARGWFPKGGFGGCSLVPKTGTKVHSDVPKNRNEGTFGCSKNRNEGTFGCSPVPKTERGYIRMFPFYETVLLFLSILVKEEENNHLMLSHINEEK